MKDRNSSHENSSFHSLPFLNTQRSTGQLNTFNPGPNLLECNQTSLIGARVFGLDVDAEGAEAAVVSGSQPLNGNIFGSLEQGVADLFRRLDTRAEGVGDADETHLSTDISST